MCFEMNCRMIRVDPDLQGIGAGFDVNLAGFQPENLRKVRSAREGIGRQFDPHAPELDGFSQFGPRIGLRQEQDQIAVFQSLGGGWTTSAKVGQ